MSKLIEVFANKIGKVRVLHDLLLKPYRMFFLAPKARKYKQQFDRYGIQALKEFTDCLDNNKYPYVLFGGTMLGAIREHGFIKHDKDADVAMWFSDYNSDMIKQLKEAGFNLYRSYSVANDKLAKELTFSHNKYGVRIDIFFFYPALDGLTKMPYHCDFAWFKGMNKAERLPRRLEYPFNHERRKASFEGIEMWIPANAEELCEFRYGADYMIPNPNWDWRKAKCNVTDWPEMISATKVTFY